MLDDLILMARSLDEIQQMKESLSETFTMKDMGQLCYCLGINFEVTEQGISVPRAVLEEVVGKVWAL